MPENPWELPNGDDAVPQVPQQRISGAGVAQGGEELARGMEEAGAGLENVATPIAAQEGREAKVAVTRNPDGSLNVVTQPSFILGPAGDTYADAAVAKSLAETKMQVDTDLANMAQQYKGDSQGFQIASTNYIQNLQNTGSPVAEHAAEYGVNVAAQHYAGILDRLGNLDVATADAALQKRQAYIENGMEDLALNGGTGTPQFQQFARERASIVATRVNNPLFAYTKDMAAVDDDNFHNGLIEWNYIGGARRIYQTTGNVNAARQYLDQSLAGIDMKPEERLRIEGLITEHLSALDAVSAQQKAQLQDAATTFNRLAYGTGTADTAQGTNLVAQLQKNRMFGPAADVEGALLYTKTAAPANWNTASGALNALNQARTLANSKINSAAAVAPINLSAADRDLVIRTVAGEAGGEPDVGQAGVAAVIRNRIQSGQYGPDARSVVMAPDQFSMWNAGNPAGDIGRNLQPGSPQYEHIGKIVDAVFSGKMADPTNGADHYYNPSEANPDWAAPLAQVNDVTIGNHRFVGGAPGPTSADVSPAMSTYYSKVQELYNNYAKTAWQNMADAYKHGYQPTAQEQADMKLLAAHITDQGLLKQVTDGLTAAAERADFATLPQTQREDLAATLTTLAQNGGLDANGRAVLGTLTAVTNHLGNLAASDPVGYAHRIIPQTAQDMLPSTGGNVTDPAQLGKVIQANRAWRVAAQAKDPSATLAPAIFTQLQRDQLNRALPVMNGQQVQGVLTTLAGVKPEELMTELPNLKNSIIGLTKSGDYQKINAAYSFMSHLQDNNPAAFEAAFNDEATSKNVAKWEAAAQFYPPQEVAKMIVGGGSPSDIAAQKQLRAQAIGEDGNGGLLKDVSYASIAQKFGNGIPFLGRTPDMMTDRTGIAQQRVVNEYKELVADYYSDGGDLAAAENWAIGRLALKYSVSPLNNGNLMAYAPDKENGRGNGVYYPKIDGSFDWMGRQFDDWMGRAAGIVNPTDDPNSGNTRFDLAHATLAADRSLVSDKITASEVANGKPPSYLVVVKGNDGLPRPLTNPATGNVLRFRPNAQMAQDESDAAKAQAMAPVLAGRAAVRAQFARVLPPNAPLQ